MPDPEFVDWEPGKHAVRFEQNTGSLRGNRLAVHLTVPFVAKLDAASAIQEDDLREIGHAYLVELDSFLQGNDDHDPPQGLNLPDGWLDALDPPFDDAPLQWLEFWPTLDDDVTDPERPAPRIASWNLVRSQQDSNETELILVAAEVLPSGDGEPVKINRELGVRVTMSISLDGDKHVVSIRSMSAEVPGTDYLSFTEIDDGLDFALDSVIKSLSEVITSDTSEISNRLQLDPDSLSFQEIRLRNSSPPILESVGRGDSLAGQDPIPYTFSCDYALIEAELRLVGTRRQVLSANSDGGETADVFYFDQDPPSWHDMAALGPIADLRWNHRRPTSTAETLHGYRVKTNVPLALETPDFVVRNCYPYVRSDPEVDGTKTIVPEGEIWPPVRSNDHSAVSAYAHMRDIYGLLDALGINIETLVVAAERAVQVFYRSGMGPGPGHDGQTINARVTLVPADAVAPFVELPHPTIEMHLALAEFFHRRRPAKTLWAEPLGIATAERWIWHEFGHVLLAARFGRLEFDFAHSAGDGMAAVVCDPFSALGELPYPRSRFRGITFPFVFTTRRHDRSVRMGWAWNGALNREANRRPLGVYVEPKGYISEQILSSSLFRLYRVLGGDSMQADGKTPDFALRERAAHLTLFLLVQAVLSLAQSPSNPGTLEAAMEVADTDMNNQLHFGPASRLPLPALADVWTGGRANKAVRWAFEAQGMLFGFDADEEVNGPGRPMEVDIYIPDRRPLAEENEMGRVHHPKGSYVPVPLDWHGEPLWQSPPGSLSFDPFTIVVGNRGRTAADGIALRIWFGFVGGNPADADWDIQEIIEWLPPITTNLPDTIEPETEAEDQVEIETPDEIEDFSGGRLLIMAEVTCENDRANSDPVAGYATAIAIDGTPPAVPRHLCDLVANDNNLALRVLIVP